MRKLLHPYGITIPIYKVYCVATESLLKKKELGDVLKVKISAHRRHYASIHSDVDQALVSRAVYSVRHVHAHIEVNVVEACRWTRERRRRCVIAFTSVDVDVRERYDVTSVRILRVGRVGRENYEVCGVLQIKPTTVDFVALLIDFVSLLIDFVSLLVDFLALLVDLICQPCDELALTFNFNLLLVDF